MMNSFTKVWGVTALLALGAGGLAGCGGGAKSGSGVATLLQVTKKTGGAKFTIHWPTDSSKLAASRSRYIPLNAQCVRITLSGPAPGDANNATPQIWAIAYSDKPAASLADPNQPASKVPTTTENIDYLPVILLNAQVDAYDVSSAELQQGKGTKLATATIPVQIFADERAPITVSLASTIQSLKITPVDPNVDLNANFKIGQAVQLQATAYDAAGGVVPLVVGKLTWTTANPDVLLFNPSTDYDTNTGFARFTPNHFGGGRVTVVDQGSNVSSFVDLTVQGAVGITPTTAVLNLYETKEFTTNVVGSANQRVNWSIVDVNGKADPNGGTLTIESNDGINSSKALYTPPLRKPGTYYLQAVSQDDPTQPAGRAKITVQSGYGHIIINNN